MTTLEKLVFGAAVGLGALFASNSASARIVCVEDDCWHAREAYEYPPAAHVVIHEDGWAAGPRVRWREHEGRGYWRGYDWTDF